MLYISKDQIPPNETYHIIKLKKDPDFSHISIRITSNKPHNGSQVVKLQILDLVSFKLPHERQLLLKKLAVLHEADIHLKINTKDRKS